MGRSGRIIVNTGDGKGKTTAALGTVIRAAGYGHRVAIIQFLKGKWSSGETTSLAAFPNIYLARIGSGFTWEKDDLEEDRSLARQAWSLSEELISSGKYDLVVLDELNVAVELGLIPIEEVIEVLQRKPQGLSVFVTGRGAKPELIEIADTVTEMREIKHAFRDGVKAQKGIEY